MTVVPARNTARGHGCPRPEKDSGVLRERFSLIAEGRSNAAIATTVVRPERAAVVSRGGRSSGA